MKTKKSTKQTSQTATSSPTRPRMQRMIAIQKIIESGRYPNVPELVQRLESSTKAIRYDIAFMRERFGHDIRFDFSRNGYYYGKTSAPIVNQHATESDIEGMHLIESACEAMRGTPGEAKAKRALDKFVDSLTNKHHIHKKGWKNIIAFRAAAEPIFDPEIFDALFRAAANREQVKVKYRKPGPDEEVHDRTLDPYNLVQRNNEWFLFAYDHGREDFRTFIPARVKSVELTGKTFRRQRSFTVNKRLNDCFGVISGDRIEDIRIAFSPRVADFIREKRWPGLKSLTELPNGGVEMHMRLSSLVEIQRWIMNWSGEAVVLHPPELKEMVLAAAQKILDEQARPQPALPMETQTPPTTVSE